VKIIYKNYDFMKLGKKGNEKNRKGEIGNIGLNNYNIGINLSEKWLK
jgi:hypothetical protein